MDAQAKQQIVERVKQANNILVTISTDPSVDQLAACIGLTLLLNRMDKHATAVFSGKVPSTVEFLQPEKTIETNTDSLRDFIISLDKAKADKLRYKVEDQVVRIFITPYKTSLSEKDLVFSQGDFNVEVVMALGITDRSQLDKAITAHGRILHDATVISVNAGAGNAPQLGQINWQDPSSSSLSEMLVSISEAFGAGLIDNQIATAFLTGIVAETNRFSNTKTSPKVMTMSAQLMAAGANQQLIVSKLEPPPPPPPKSAPREPKPPVPGDKPQAPKKGGTLSISHDASKADSPEVEIAPNEIHIDEQGNLKTAAELKAEKEKVKQSQFVAPPPITTQTPEPPAAPGPEPAPPLPPVEMPPPIPSRPTQHPLQPPPRPPKARVAETHPHELLDPQDHRPALEAPFTANTEPEWIDPYNSVPIDPLSSPPQGADGLFGHSLNVTPPADQPHITTADLASLGSAPAPMVDNARSAVQDAYAAAPPSTDFPEQVSSLNAAPLGPELHAPETSPVSTNNDNGTPSLNLPTNGVPPTPPPGPPPITLPPAK